METKEDKELSEAVLGALSGEFSIINIRRIWDESELVIEAKFQYQGRLGQFRYTLMGRGIGIDDLEYSENPEEDIYEIILNWVSENITTQTTIKWGRKTIK